MTHKQEKIKPGEEECDRRRGSRGVVELARQNEGSREEGKEGGHAIPPIRRAPAHRCIELGAGRETASSKILHKRHASRPHGAVVEGDEDDIVEEHTVGLNSAGSQILASGGGGSGRAGSLLGLQESNTRGDTQGAIVLLTGAPLISLDKCAKAVCGHDWYRGGAGSWALREVSVEDRDPMSGEPGGGNSGQGMGIRGAGPGIRMARKDGDRETGVWERCSLYMPPPSAGLRDPERPDVACSRPLLQSFHPRLDVRKRGGCAHGFDIRGTGESSISPWRAGNLRSKAAGQGRAGRAWWLGSTPELSERLPLIALVDDISPKPVDW
ncbi:hypothetical protein FB45DRAFT_871075 [Roridomyces roridus]|uniref:Uncharacterized protein n=1 Tax=Roridomyces roridus TaxID=1738132 RepID=A0AAD7FFS0_9AGAR|nr:hypothetical protein FB45DRAFT_871075 [Roridomyces roridus]